MGEFVTFDRYTYRSGFGLLKVHTNVKVTGNGNIEITYSPKGWWYWIMLCVFSVMLIWEIVNIMKKRNRRLNFQRRTDNTLKAFSRTLVELQENITNLNKWEYLKLCCPHISGDATRSSFFQIRDLAEAIEELLHSIIEYELFFKPVAELFNTLPDKIQRLASDEKESTEGILIYISTVIQLKELIKKKQIFDEPSFVKELNDISQFYKNKLK